MNSIDWNKPVWVKKLNWKVDVFHGDFKNSDSDLLLVIHGPLKEVAVFHKSIFDSCRGYEFENMPKIKKFYELEDGAKFRFITRWHKGFDCLLYKTAIVNDYYWTSVGSHVLYTFEPEEEVHVLE